MILETILGGGAHDAIIVPISIGYDKVIETSTYMNELLGNPKERESLWGMLTNTRVLQLKWGSIDGGCIYCLGFKAGGRESWSEVHDYA